VIFHGTEQDSQLGGADRVQEVVARGLAIYWPAPQTGNP
jgi:hypothetical protein